MSARGPGRTAAVVTGPSSAKPNHTAAPATNTVSIANSMPVPPSDVSSTTSASSAADVQRVARGRTGTATASTTWIASATPR